MIDRVCLRFSSSSIIRAGAIGGSDLTRTRMIPSTSSAAALPDTGPIRVIRRRVPARGVPLPVHQTSRDLAEPSGLPSDGGFARLDSAHGVSNLHALRRFAPADGRTMRLRISRAHMSVVAARFIRTRFIFVGSIRPRSPGSVASVNAKRARLADRGCPNLRWTSGLHSRLRSVPATLRAPHFRGPRRSERRRIVPALGFASFRFVGTALTAALRLPSTSIVRGSNRARSSASAKRAPFRAARRGILRARRDSQASPSARGLGRSFPRFDASTRCRRGERCAAPTVRRAAEAA